MNNKQSKQLEEQFRLALSNYKSDPTQSNKDTLFFLILNACQANAKSYIARKHLTGSRLLSDIMDRAMDAAIDTFRKILEGKEIETTLITYSRCWVMYHLCHKCSNKSQDRELQLIEGELNDNYYPDLLVSPSFEDEIIDSIC